MGPPNNSTKTNPAVDDPDVLSEFEIDRQRHEWQMWQVVKDLQNLPLISVDFMLENFIPDLEIDIQATREALERQGVLSPVVGWNELAPSPTDTDRLDGKTDLDFARMSDIHNHIVASTVFKDGLRHTPSFRIRTFPAFAPVSPKNARSGPDACGEFIAGHSHHFMGLTGQNSWYNTAYVEEYEHGDAAGEFRTNAKKMLWSLGNMMNYDHRRRFAFGLSIENRSARLWFCCRQVIFATHTFDFMNKPDILISIIASLSYATPLQLGFDPTVKLIESRGRWRYRITICGKNAQGTLDTKTYETVRIINAAAARYSKIRGRATRIFEVYDVDDKTKTCLVLKDSWIDASQPLEGDTLATILDGASEEERALFLTVLQHGIVNIDGKEDRTRDSILHGYDISIAHHFGGPKGVIMFRPRVVSESSESDSLGQFLGSMEPYRVFPEPDKMLYEADVLEIDPDHDSTIRKSHADSPKLHYRLVFREKGVSLQDMARTQQARLSTIMIAMHDTMQALHVMWKKKYVHRDVSPGNIIIYNGRARLSDLEFAIPYQEPPEKPTVVVPGITAPSVGTYHFMASEVMKGLFYATPPTKPIKTLFNPLHDVESVWWIGVWFLVCHYSPTANLSNPAIQTHIKLLRVQEQKLFPKFTDRWLHSEDRTDQVMGVCKLPWEVFSKPQRQFYDVVERMRVEICRCLFAAEATFPVDVGHFNDTMFYDTFCGFFDADDIQDEVLWPMNDISEGQRALLSGQADAPKALLPLERRRTAPPPV